jgi:exonuclease VII small subunit
MAMKTIQSQEQREEIRKVLEKIVQELENSRLYEGKISVERVLPAP